MFTYENVFIFVHFFIYTSHYVCICKILHPRSWVKYAFFYCLPFLIFSIGYEIVSGDVRSSIRYLLQLTSFFLPALILFQDKLLHKISVALFTHFIPMFSEAIIGNTLWPLLQFIFHLPYSPSDIVSHDQVSILCIYLIPMVIIECIATCKGDILWNYFHLNFNLKIIFEIMFYPILSASCIVAILNYSYISVLIITFLIIFLGNLLFLKGLKDLADNMKNARNNQKMKKNLELLLSDYEAMEQQILSIRLQNHDIANHLRTVEYLISENQVDEAAEYLKTFYYSHQLKEVIIDTINCGARI